MVRKPYRSCKCNSGHVILFEHHEMVLSHLNDDLSLWNRSSISSQTEMYLNDTQLKNIAQLIQAQAVIL